MSRDLQNVPLIKRAQNPWSQTIPPPSLGEKRPHCLVAVQCTVVTVTGGTYCLAHIPDRLHALPIEDRTVQVTN